MDNTEEKKIISKEKAKKKKEKPVRAKKVKPVKPVKKVKTPKPKKEKIPRAARKKGANQDERTKAKVGNSVLSQYCDAPDCIIPVAGYWCTGTWHGFL